MSPTEAADRPATIHRPCPNCGAPFGSGRPTGAAREGWTIVSCVACGFVHLPEAPVVDRFVDEFAWEKTWEENRKARAAAQPVLIALDHATRFRLAIKRRKAKDVIAANAEPGPIIELGCGDGKQLLPPPPGFTPHGVDISAELAKRADAAFRPHGGSCVHASAIEGLATFPERYFTAGLLHSYLEHEIEPVAVLAALRRVLKPGAPIVVKVPNYASWNRRLMGEKWCGYRFPDHVNYFTPESLTAVADRAGFDTIFKAGWTIPTSDNMWALLRARG